MKRKFLVNPVAGKGRVKQDLECFRKFFLDTEGVFETDICDSRNAMTEKTSEALRSGYQQIVAVGGDGTVNAVANGFFDKELTAINPEACLAVAPLGSGSDYFRTIGRNNRDWKNTVLNPDIHLVDVGVLEAGPERSRILFVNDASTGLSADVVASKNRLPSWIPRKLSYVVPTIQQLTKAHPFKARLQLDKEVIDDDFLAILIAKGRYAGGGMLFGKNVKLDDGRFEVTVIGKLAPLKALRGLPHLFTGRMDEIEGIRKLFCHKVTIETQTHVLVETDGELCGKTPVTLQVLPRILRVCS